MDPIARIATPMCVLPKKRIPAAVEKELQLRPRSN
jgi:hypothetical protein